MFIPFTFSASILISSSLGASFEDDATKSRLRSRQWIEDPEESRCQVYVAPSSLPNAGLGIFAGRKFRKGDMILGADGPSIPIVDPDLSQKSMDTWLDLFSLYIWDGGISDPALFESNYTIEFSSAALPNSHPILNNMDISHPAVVPYDETLDRTRSPGAGAVSYLMGRNLIATSDIDEGKEIFLRYPDDYMNTLCSKHNIPRKRNYKEAAQIVMNLMRSFGSNFTEWKESSSYVSVSDITSSLLPSSQKDVDKITPIFKDRGVIVKEKAIIIAIAEELSVKNRSFSWLTKHGTCLDNIVPGQSTNPRAGKGAIAKHFIQKGNVVAPAPVLQITDLNALRMPAFHGDKWQLLLNYCLGHEKSSLLLCPYTNSILVNHCSSRNLESHPCGQDQTPNAEYRWADWDHATDSWLTMTVDDMKRHRGKGLVLEIVATKDIPKGEEVFVDYGISWEIAWERHIKQWKPSPSYLKREWTSITTLNRELGPLPLAPSLHENYISSDFNKVLFTGCYYYETNESLPQREEKFQMEPEQSWMNMPIQQVVQKYGRISGNTVYKVDENGTYSDGDFWPCVVVNKSIHDEGIDEDQYIVRIIQSPYHNETLWEKMNVPRLILNYPRSSIRHFYKPYQSDIWLPGVFRHPMGLPDDLFPMHWRNL